MSQFPAWQIELVVVSATILAIMAASFGIALLVEWYRGWPSWRR